MTTETTLTPPVPPTVRRRSKRWWLLALLPVLALAVTESLALTTWTPLPALIRGESTLDVVVDNAAVEVTIAGEGLVRTARGSRTETLPPGRYELWATWRGKILKESWVTLARGEKATWEQQKPVPQRPPAKPFVLLTRDYGPEKQFDTLAKAVRHADSGDTIEIHGNGPFETDPIQIQGKPLAIRAADGFWPVLRLKPEATASLIHADAPLLLEGLEFDGMVFPADKGLGPQVYANAALYVCNCRFKQGGPRNVIGGGGPIREAVNCEFDNSSWVGVSWLAVPGGRCVLDNCLFTKQPQGVATSFHLQPGKEPATIRMTHNTLLWCEFRIGPKLEPGKIAPIQVELADNIFVTKRQAFFVNQHPNDDLSLEQMRSLVPDVFRFTEERCLYSPNHPILRYTVKFKDTGEGALTDLAEWQQFWKIDTPGSLQEAVKFQRNDPQELEDFRLAKDSPGKGAGKDGRDLGADVDLVGPGPGYERWRRTAAYKEWSKKVDQVLAGEE